jgi:hypothetical protein
MGKLKEGEGFINKTLSGYDNVRFRLSEMGGTVDTSFMEAFGHTAPLAAVWSAKVIEEGILTVPSYGLVKFFMHMGVTRESFQNMDTGYCKQYGYEFKFEEKSTWVYKTEKRAVTKGTAYSMFASDYLITAHVENPSAHLTDIMDIIKGVCDPDVADYVIIAAIQLIKVGEVESIAISNKSAYLKMPCTQQLLYETMTKQYDRIVIQKLGECITMSLSE